MGGAEVYALALPRADDLILTEIDADLDGDAFFPAWDRTAFDRVTVDARVDGRGTPYRFVTYRRRDAVADGDDRSAGPGTLSSPIGRSASPLEPP